MILVVDNGEQYGTRRALSPKVYSKSYMSQLQRPKFLNLFHIRLPVTGVVSIAHRISGAMLVLLTPILIYLLDVSLRDAQGYDQARNVFDHPFVRFLAVFLIWGLAHHALAGFRHLLFDLDIGFSRAAARRSAVLVLAGGALVLALMLGWSL